MPSSTWVPRSTFGDLIYKYNAESVLDVGPGFGFWGFFCREILDVFQGRIFKKDWKKKIDCIEIFPQYIVEHHRYLYNDIIIDDALRYLEKYLPKYEMIIAGDVLEHFEKPEGYRLLDVMYKCATKAVLVGVPIGSGYRQGTVQGNTREAHLAVWNVADFKNIHYVTRVSTVNERIKQRPYGIVVMEKKA